MNTFGIFYVRLPNASLGLFINLFRSYFLLLFFLPVLLAAIKPTFLPGGAPRATVVTLRPPLLLLP